MKEDKAFDTKESLSKDKTQNKQDSTSSCKDRWKCNRSGLAFEVHSILFSSNQFINKRSHHAIDIKEQSTIYDMKYLTDNMSMSSGKVGRHITKKVLPQSFKLPFLGNRVDSPIQGNHLTSKSSPNAKAATNAKSDCNFQYRKIFFGKRLFTNKKNYIENKLNIDYAETVDQYEERLLKENKKRRARGLRIKHENKSDHLEVKLKDLREKIRFMKGVVDYSYPSFVVHKIKVINKMLKEELQVEKEKNYHGTPYELRDNTQKEINDKRRTFLSQSIHITH